MSFWTILYAINSLQKGEEYGRRKMFNKFMRALRRGHRNEKGITGLETAIILIAFVTVAAVFGYAVLSAGIFSAEKGKETVYLGLQEAKSTMELTGSVVAMGDNATDTVSSVKFTVRNALGGEAIDLTVPPNNKSILTYIDSQQYHNDAKFALTWVGHSDNDSLLEVGEKAQITFDCTDIDPNTAGTSLDPALGCYTKFTIEFKPPAGSVVTVERITPGDMDPVMNLH